MESIEKLREKLAKSMDTWFKRELVCIADEIEAEIAEKYMELPLDADGVPIHCGDRIISEEGRKGDVYLIGVSELMTRLCTYHKTAEVHHVKPRTLEDVLEDAFIECDEDYGIDRTEVIERYAAEIRELLGVE